MMDDELLAEILMVLACVPVSVYGAMMIGDWAIQKLRCRSRRDAILRRVATQSRLSSIRENRRVLR